jgi:hypothetical protein
MGTQKDGKTKFLRLFHWTHIVSQAAWQWTCDVSSREANQSSSRAHPLKGISWLNCTGKRTLLLSSSNPLLAGRKVPLKQSPHRHSLKNPGFVVVYTFT